MTPEVSRYLAGIKNTPYFYHLIFGRDDGTFGEEFDALVDQGVGMSIEDFDLDNPNSKLSPENKLHIKRALRSLELIDSNTNSLGDPDEERIYELVVAEIPD